MVSRERKKSSTTIATPTTPTTEMNNRMRELLVVPGNKVCADCPASRPLWVSFLFSPVNRNERVMGVFVCSKCAQHHHIKLGSKRCMIKYRKMAHEWTTEDVEILESSSNDFVNRVYESALTDDDFNKKFIHPDDEEEDFRRSKFIKHKYKTRQFTNDVVFHEMMLELLLQKEKRTASQQQQSRGHKAHRRSERVEAPKAQETPRSKTVTRLDKERERRRRVLDAGDMGVQSGKHDTRSPSDSMLGLTVVQDTPRQKATERRRSRRALTLTSVTGGSCASSVATPESVTPSSVASGESLSQRRIRRKSNRNLHQVQKILGGSTSSVSTASTSTATTLSEDLSSKDGSAKRMRRQFSLRGFDDNGAVSAGTTPRGHSWRRSMSNPNLFAKQACQLSHPSTDDSPRSTSSTVKDDSAHVVVAKSSLPNPKSLAQLLERPPQRTVARRQSLSSILDIKPEDTTPLMVQTGLAQPHGATRDVLSVYFGSPQANHNMTRRRNSLSSIAEYSFTSATEFAPSASSCRQAQGKQPVGNGAVTPDSAQVQSRRTRRGSMGASPQSEDQVQSRRTRRGSMGASPQSEEPANMAKTETPGTLPTDKSPKIRRESLGNDYKPTTQSTLPTPVDLGYEDVIIEHKPRKQKIKRSTHSISILG